MLHVALQLCCLLRCRIHPVAFVVLGNFTFFAPQVVTGGNSLIVLHTPANAFISDET